jgi:phospholipase C
MTDQMQFEHVVVLMLENRSFDHIFGYLGTGEGLPARGGVNYLKPGDNTSEKFASRKGGDYTAVGPGPSHSLKETNLQLFGKTKPTAVDAKNPTMSGFVASFENALQPKLKRKPTSSELQQVMNVFDPVQLPVLSTLAKGFVLCDHWHADVPGPTMPNRAFVHAATSQGYTYNADWKPKFTCKTIYDRFNGAPDKSWRIYYHDQNDVVELYPQVKSDTTNHVLFESHYLSDVQGDKLATYSFIIPGFMHTVNSMHAPADVRPAEKLIADVYDALRGSPEVWKKTLLIVTFDEHGGYYDHVVPPATVSPDGIAGRLDESYLVPFDFKRLGLRVPTILISPWFEPAVDSTLYSHSTIPGTLIEAFGLPSGYLTERDKQANKLTKYMTFDARRRWRTDIPDVDVPAQPEPLDDMQRELLNGTVHMDPHPEARNELRTQDIQDPQQAKQFMRTQVAKRLEHAIAARGRPRGSMSASNQLPSTSVSAARIQELHRSKPGTPSRRNRKPQT